jgi:hypothetical protein
MTNLAEILSLSFLLSFFFFLARTRPGVPEVLPHGAAAEYCAAPPARAAVCGEGLLRICSALSLPPHAAGVDAAAGLCVQLPALSRGRFFQIHAVATERTAVIVVLFFFFFFFPPLSWAVAAAETGRGVPGRLRAAHGAGRPGAREAGLYQESAQARGGRSQGRGWHALSSSPPSTHHLC